MNEQLEKTLEDLKEKRKPFSLFILVNKYKIPTEIVKSNIKNIINHEDLNTYMFVYCSKCNSKLYEMEYDEDFLKKNLTCYKCKENFKPMFDLNHYYFDFRTLKERYKSL